CQHAYDAPFTF
nr:immunoglobulin light chain junction region [Macaca mulatta]